MPLAFDLAYILFIDWVPHFNDWTRVCSVLSGSVYMIKTGWLLCLTSVVYVYHSVSTTLLNVFCERDCGSSFGI